jgi:hypothetical protein
VRISGWCVGLLTCVWLATTPAARAEERLEPERLEPERIDYTAYTLRRNEFLVGVGSAAYGIFDQMTIGTYVLPWFAFPLLDAPIATGFLKVRDWFSGPVTVSLRGTFVYLDATTLSSKLLKDTSTEASLLVVPITLGASWRISEVATQSLELMWVHVRVGGDMPNDTSIDAGLGGASTASSATLSALSELRVNREFAVTLRGTLLLGFSDIVVRADYERRDTRVNAKLGAQANYPSVVGNIIPGVAFSWTHVNLHLGLGFGSNWLPIVGIPTRQVTLVPDADFYVRF